MNVHSIIQLLKVMYLILTLQVPLTLPSVFSKTDSVFLKEDTKKCVLCNTCPRTYISQYYNNYNWIKICDVKIQSSGTPRAV